MKRKRKFQIKISPHIPVLLRESINFLNVHVGRTYVDCTFGGGNHSQEILKRERNIRLICFEKDERMLWKYFKTDVPSSGYFTFERMTVVHSDFVYLDFWCKKLGVREVDGFIFDLGLSVEQILDSQRGFSYKKSNDAPLDMRIDQRDLLTAGEVIEEASQWELERIFREFGERKFANLVAKKIVQARKVTEIKTTHQLAEIVNEAIPQFYRRRSRRNPSRKIFQALRIFVNKELEVLKLGLESAMRLISVEGRICVISFHSLEDRVIMKIVNQLKWDSGLMKNNGIKGKVYSFLTKKPILPNLMEVSKNPRSRSAKLWVIERKK